MNRLLLKECLDELRSDDLEELTEADEKTADEKNGDSVGTEANQLIPGIQNEVFGVSQPKAPAQTGSNA